MFANVRFEVESLPGLVQVGVLRQEQAYALALKAHDDCCKRLNMLHTMTHDMDWTVEEADVIRASITQQMRNRATIENVMDEIGRPKEMSVPRINDLIKRWKQQKS